MYQCVLLVPGNDIRKTSSAGVEIAVDCLRSEKMEKGKIDQ